jgi:hypothetical protein
MRKKHRPTLALLTALLLAPLAVGSSEARLQDDGPRCLKCSNQGRLVCKQHKKVDCLLETNVLYCSYMASCEPCAGTGWVDCPKCDNEASAADFRVREAARADIEKGVKEQNEKMGRELPTAESEHFTLVWETDGLKVGRSRMNDHQLLHLYIDRLEKLYLDYVELFDIEDREFGKKSRVFVWGLLSDHEEAGMQFCEFSAKNGVYLRGMDAVYSVLGSKKNFKSDEELHRNLVHHVTHGLISMQKPANWMGKLRAGWADAGLAHWFEERYFEVADNYCYQENNLRKSMKKGSWKVAAHRMTKEEEVPPLAALFQLDTDNLDGPQHVASFAFVDFLIQKDPKLFNTLLKRLRAKHPARDALKELYGVKVLELEEQWKTWMLDTYPSR